MQPTTTSATSKSVTIRQDLHGATTALFMRSTLFPAKTDHESTAGNAY